MDEILHLIWQINYTRDKEAICLVISHVSCYNDIAGQIKWENNELSFGSRSECLVLLHTRFEKSILI
jgi:hypothetical protein